MKKVLFTIFVLMSLFKGMSQGTLFANESHTMTLFFPSPIRQAITGNDSFTFSYNRENGQHFGLLQANKGNASNLLVITQDGRVYSFQLEYRKQLPESYRFVQIMESIGRETQMIVLPSAVPKETLSGPSAIVPENGNLELMKKGAEYLLNKKSKPLRTKRKEGLVLRLKEMFYHGDKVYVELGIRNNSGIDFEVDVLEVYKVNGRKGRRSSHQKVPLAPIFKHDQPTIVRSGHRHAFVYVLSKFTLGSSERLLLELHEKKGNRMLRLSHR